MSRFLLKISLTWAAIAAVLSFVLLPYPLNTKLVIPKLPDTPSPFFPRADRTDFSGVIPVFLPFTGTVQTLPSDDFVEDILYFFGVPTTDAGDPDFFSTPPRAPSGFESTGNEPVMPTPTGNEPVMPTYKPLKEMICVTLLRPVSLQQSPPASSSRRQGRSQNGGNEPVRSHYWYGKKIRKRYPVVSLQRSGRLPPPPVPSGHRHGSQVGFIGPSASQTPWKLPPVVTSETPQHRGKVAPAPPAPPPPTPTQPPPAPSSPSGEPPSTPAKPRGPGQPAVIRIVGPLQGGGGSSELRQRQPQRLLLSTSASPPGPGQKQKKEGKANVGSEDAAKLPLGRNLSDQGKGDDPLPKASPVSGGSEPRLKSRLASENHGTLLKPPPTPKDVVLLKHPPTPQKHAALLKSPPTPPSRGPLLKPPPIPRGHGPLLKPPPIPRGQRPLLKPPPIPRGHGPLLKPPPIPRGHGPLLKTPPIPRGRGSLLKPPPRPRGHGPLLKPPPRPRGHGPLLKPPPTPSSDGRQSGPASRSRAQHAHQPAGLPPGVEMVNLTAIYGVSGTQCTCTPLDQCPEGRGRKTRRCGGKHVCCPDELLLHTKCGVLEQEASNVQNSGKDKMAAPWAATILMKLPSGYVFVCGGALIHPRVVLTDARCVHSLVQEVLVVRLGEGLDHNTSRPMDHQEIPVLRKMAGSEDTHVRQSNQVALLILKSAARLRPGLGTLCVRRGPPPSEECHMATYNMFSKGSSVTSSWWPSPACRQVLSSYPGTALNSLSPVCPELNPTGPVGGDRPGAPVSCADPRSGRHRLAGFVAWGDRESSAEGRQPRPGVFNRLQPFYRWIDNHVTRYFRYHHPYFGELQE